jgi:deazaflavin-dependent oxidoreductase (nitroreductase family)
MIACIRRSCPSLLLHPSTSLIFLLPCFAEERDSLWRYGGIIKTPGPSGRKRVEYATNIVASGFGEKADWYKNVMAHPEITIQVGRRRMAACAERLPLPQATDEMLDYNRRHPAALRTLAGLLGYRSDGSEADVRFLAGVIPILALMPLDRDKSREGA